MCLAGQAHSTDQWHVISITGLSHSAVIKYLESGMMLLALVTIPLTDMRRFESDGSRSLITLCVLRLNGRT